MRRIALALTVLGMMFGVVLPSRIVEAAPGDVDTTPLTLPASVASLTSKSSFDDGRGGMYLFFADSSTLSVVRVDSAGTVNTDFGTAGVASVALASADSLSYRVSTMPVTGASWIVVEDSAADTVHLLSLSGSGTFGSPVAVDTTPVTDSCYGAGNTGIVNPNPYPRRNGGVWITWFCSIPSPDPVPSPAQLTAYDNTGTYEAAIGVVDIEDPAGTGATCATLSRTVADPTGSASAELLIFRVLHAAQSAGGDCISSGRYASTIASSYSGIDLLSIDSTGTVVRSAVTLAAGVPAIDISGLMIDPGGRILALTRELSNTSQGGVLRFGADRTVDTSIGTDGYLPLTLPSAAGADATGTRLEFLGLVTTPDEVLFAVGIPDSFGIRCSGTWTLELGYQVCMLSLASGWLAEWGAAGIGDAVLIERTNAAASCPPVLYGGKGVDSNGRARLLSYAQDGSPSLNLWQPVEGVTGGGVGGTGSGGFTSDTGGAPSTGDGLSTIEQPTATTTTVAETTTTAADTTTTVADETTTTVSTDPADTTLPATGGAAPVAIAVLLAGVGSMLVLRRRTA